MKVERLSFSVTRSTDGWYAVGRPSDNITVCCPVDTVSEAYGEFRKALNRIWEEQAGLEKLAPTPRGRMLPVRKRLWAWWKRRSSSPSSPTVTDSLQRDKECAEALERIRDAVISERVQRDFEPEVLRKMGIDYV